MIGAGMQSNAATNAANQQADASRYATDTANQQFNQVRQSLNPFIQGGTNAASQLGAMGPENFRFSQNDPSYQWRLQQGLAAVNASAAAQGGYFSGATGQALQNYGQGAASQEYQNEFNRYNTQYQNNYSNLYNVASMGENAAAGLGNTGMQNAQYAGQNAMSAANATGQAGISNANTWANALAGVNNNLMSGPYAYLLNQSGSSNWMNNENALGSQIRNINTDFSF